MEPLALQGGPAVRATRLPYARQTIEADDTAAVQEALGGDWITQGPLVARFEQALAARASVAHAVAFSSGTAALHGACWAAGLGPGDEAMTTLSFHPAKLITTGEGGAVLTDRADFADRLRTMRHHGILYADAARPWRHDIPELGQNYRLTDFQSALGLSQLAKLDRFWERRDRLARRYRDRLGDSPFVELPALPKELRHGWHLFVVTLRLERLGADRDAIVEALRAENIGATVHYPLVYRHTFYRERFGYAAGLCPAAETVEARLVTLPLFPAMTEGDQDDVLHALDKVFAHYAR